MSKSLGNFHTVSEILAKGYTGRELRFALIRVQYRQSLNFTLAGLSEGRAAIARVNEARKSLVRVRDGADLAGADDLVDAVQTANDTFTSSMQDDLNVSEALAAIFDFVTACNKASPSVAGATVALQSFARFEDVLAVFGDEPEAAEDAPAELVALLDKRQEAKTEKDWTAADQIRDKIAAAGWKIVDTPSGARLERV